MYDLAIIGGGPAGVAAGVYAARKRLKTAFFTESWGGQSVDSMDIQNWIGTPHVSGLDFANILKAHLVEYASDAVHIKEERVEQVTKTDSGFSLKTKNGEINAKTILVTSGSTRRKLQIPGAEEFENKGITYCASCDGPLFSGQDTLVIGGGNAGFETAAQLLAYAKSVTLITHGAFRADPVTVEKVLSHPNMKAHENTTPIEIKGDKFVSSVTVEDSSTKEKRKIQVGGVFVEIGLVPSTSFIKDLVPMNQYGQIIIDPKTQATQVSGIWAAGDCTDTLYHQNNIAAGDAVRALEDIYMHLNTK